MDGFWTWPLFAVVPLLFAAMAGAHELGLWLHARLAFRAEEGDAANSDEGFILSGVLGLLALLMAFSFSMALSRLEDRRELMLQEASAMGNLHMLADGLPPAQASALQADLATYGAARLKAAKMPDGPARVAAEVQAEALRDPVADKVRAVVAQGPVGPMEIALASAFDTVEDVAVRRQALAQAHLPARVMWLLGAYALISAAMMGYALAGGRARHRAASSTFYLLVSMAFGVVLDLDRPQAGGIMIDQGPFAKAVEALRE